jgi:hypothetical protein
VLPEKSSTPTTRGTIPKPSNYRQFASDVEWMFVRASELVSQKLDDLNQALAGTARALEKEGPSAELVGLKNSLICVHDVLKVYEKHHLEVPERLTTIQRLLEQRRNEIAPHP